jgi:hypothetical protein
MNLIGASGYCEAQANCQEASTVRYAVQHAGPAALRPACLLILGVPPGTPGPVMWAALASVRCPTIPGHHPGICSIIAEPARELRAPLGLDDASIVFWNDIRGPGSSRMAMSTAVTAQPRQPVQVTAPAPASLPRLCRLSAGSLPSRRCPR